MSNPLERDLEELQEEVQSLAAGVEEALQQAVEAVQRCDPALARRVLSKDRRGQRTQLTASCVDLLARHHPSALPLRRLAAVLKLASNLDAMIQVAQDVARLALDSKSPLSLPQQVKTLADLAAAMVRDSVAALVELDLQRCRRVRRFWDELARFQSDWNTAPARNPQSTRETVHRELALAAVVGSLVLTARHAVAIADDVIYLVEGRPFRPAPAAVKVVLR